MIPAYEPKHVLTLFFKVKDYSHDVEYRHRVSDSDFTRLPEKVIPHPKYRMDQPAYHDIALIRLDKPLDDSRWRSPDQPILPVCLPPPGFRDENREGYVAGLGLTAFPGMIKINDTKYRRLKTNGAGPEKYQYCINDPKNGQTGDYHYYVLNGKVYKMLTKGSCIPRPYKNKFKEVPDRPDPNPDPCRIFYREVLGSWNDKHQDIDLFVIKQSGKPPFICSKKFATAKEVWNDWDAWCPTCRYNAEKNSKILIILLLVINFSS